MKKVEQKNIVVMTATITPPPGVLLLARADPAVRLNDYRSALEFYISLLGRSVDGIVFADNSNSNVGVLRDLVREAGVEDRVEFLVFDDLDYAPELGRAYGELRLLEYVMDHSETIREAGPDCVVWKATGRYKVRNLISMIRRRPATFDVYCDMRNQKAPWCDMRVMAWTPSGYDAVLRGLHEGLLGPPDSNLVGEQQLYDLLTPRLGNGKVVASYTVEPLIDGHRGWDNKQWGLGRQRAVYYLRSSQRRLLGKVLI
mgnify:CR=1 FL=1